MKLGENVGSLTLERGTKLEHPIDYRLATIRKDAGIIASNIYKGCPELFTIEIMDDIYRYIINGKQTPQTEGWK